MMPKEKRCWICGKTQAEIAAVYDIDEQIKDKNVWVKEAGMTWWHNICIVCRDAIISLSVGEFAIEDSLEDEINKVINKRIKEVLKL